MPAAGSRQDIVRFHLLEAGRSAHRTGHHSSAWQISGGAVSDTKSLFKKNLALSPQKCHLKLGWRDIRFQMSFNVSIMFFLGKQP